MADNVQEAGVLFIRIDSDIDAFEARLKGLGTKLGDSFETKGAGRAVKKEINEVDEAVKDLTDRLKIGRNTYVSNLSSSKDFKEGLELLRAEMIRQIETGKLNNTQLAKLTTSLATAQRATDTLEGRASKLGLAHQVNIALAGRMTSSLQSFGPAGTLAGGALGLVANGLTKVGTGSLGVSLNLGQITQLLQALPAIATVGLAALTAFAVAGLKRAADEAANFADEIDQMSLRAGISTDAVQELQHATSIAGGSFADVETAIKGMTARLKGAEEGSDKQAAAFARLGIETKNTNGELKDIEGIFFSSIEALQGIENATERNIAAQALFGKGASNLNPILNLTRAEFQGLLDDAENLGLVLDNQSITALADYKDRIETVEKQFRLARFELTSAFLPVLEKGLIPLLQNGVLPFLQGAADKAAAFTDRLFEGGVEGDKFREKIAEAILPTVLLGYEIFNLGKTLGGLGLAFASTFNPITQLLDVFNARLSKTGELWNAIFTGQFGRLGEIQNDISLLDGEITLAFQNLTDNFASQTSNMFEAGFTSGFASADRDKIKAGIIDFFEDVGVGVDAPNSRTRVAGESDGETYVDSFADGVSSAAGGSGGSSGGSKSNAKAIISGALLNLLKASYDPLASTGQNLAVQFAQEQMDKQAAAFVKAGKEAFEKNLAAIKADQAGTTSANFALALLGLDDANIKQTAVLVEQQVAKMLSQARFEEILAQINLANAQAPIANDALALLGLDAENIKQTEERLARLAVLMEKLAGLAKGANANDFSTSLSGLNNDNFDAGQTAIIKEQNKAIQDFSSILSELNTIYPAYVANQIKFANANKTILASLGQGAGKNGLISATSLLAEAQYNVLDSTKQNLTIQQRAAQAQQGLTDARELFNQTVDASVPTYQEEIDNLLKLIALYPENTAEILKMVEALELLRAEQEANKATIDTLKQITAGINILTDIASTDFSNGNNVIDLISNSAADLLAMIPIIGGELASLARSIGSLFNTIFGDMANGMKQVREELDELGKSSKLLSQETIDALAVTKRVSRGGLLGFLGFTKEALDEEATNLGISIANSLAEASIAGILQGGEEFDKQFKNMIERLAVEAALLTGTIQEKIARLSQLIRDALADGVIDANEKAAIEAEKASLRAELDATRQTLIDSGVITPTTSTTTNSGSGSPATPNLPSAPEPLNTGSNNFSNASTGSTFAPPAPSVQIGLLSPLARYFDQFGTHVAQFGIGARQIWEAAQTGFKVEVGTGTATAQNGTNRRPLRRNGY